MGARASQCFLKNNAVEGEAPLAVVSNEVQAPKAEAEERNKLAAEVAKKKQEEAAGQAKAAAEAKAAEEKKKAAEKAAKEKKAKETTGRVSTPPLEKESTEASEPEPEGRVTPPVASKVPPARPPTGTIPSLPAAKAPKPEVPSAALQAPVEERQKSVENLEADIWAKYKLQTKDEVEAASTVGKVEEKRVDPFDRKTYTFEEIAKHYKNQYNAAEIQVYWAKECKPMKANDSKPAPKRNNQNKKKSKN